MIRHFFTICASVSVAVAAMAQGGISEDMMARIRQGWQGTPEEQALRNAISANDINKLSVKLGIESTYDFYFSDEVP